jgi:tetratricopeptide (TPR) repeat protein
LNRSIRIRSHALVALLAPWLLAACAGLGGGTPGPGREVRPDAPPEYDVLVYYEHAQDGRLHEAKAALRRAIAKDPDSPFLHRSLSELLARNSELDAAVDEAKIACDLDPDDEAARGLLAQLYRIQQDVDGAEALLLDANGAPPDAASAWLLYQLYLEVGALDKAYAVARWMTEHDPDDLRGWVALAKALESLGRPEEAEQAYREALALDPDNLRIYAQLARMMRQQGDEEGAIDVYREMLERYPDDHATLASLAQAQFDDEDLEGAIETFERIEANYPGDVESMKRLGYLLYEAGRYEEAGLRFERVLALAPGDGDVAFFQGIVMRRLSRSDEAVGAFSRIPPSHEYYADARTQLAGIHERSGRYVEALADVELALQAEPTRELELYGVTLRAKIGDFDGAVAYLEKLLDESPEDDELLYHLGVVHAEADRDDEAITYMQRALEKNPDNADAINFIGYTWAEQGTRLDEAEAYIERAIELRPDNGYIVDSLGWVYYMRARAAIDAGERAKGRAFLDRALEELERANELTGGDPVIHEHIGDAYLLMERPRRALDEFEEAARMGPRSDEQPELQEKLETLRRELE